MRTSFLRDEGVQELSLIDMIINYLFPAGSICNLNSLDDCNDGLTCEGGICANLREYRGRLLVLLQLSFLQFGFISPAGVPCNDLEDFCDLNSVCENDKICALKGRWTSHM